MNHAKSYTESILILLIILASINRITLQFNDNFESIFNANLLKPG